MIEVMKEAFWATATQLTELIVPVIVIYITMRLFLAGLYGSKG